MISRIVAVIIVVALAYAVVPRVAPYLPAIHLKEERKTAQPSSLNDALSLYLTHENGDNVHILATPYAADWDSHSQDMYVLYQLAGLVPVQGDQYASSGYEIEGNYESFLLSIQPGDDPHYEALLESYKQSKTAVPKPKGRSHTSQPAARLQNEALKQLIDYLKGRRSGPTAPRLGKALEYFYGDVGRNVSFPSGDNRNLKLVDTFPDVSVLRANPMLIPAVEFVVPGVAGSSDTTSTQTAVAQQLKIVELTIRRPWLDLDLIRSFRNGPFYGQRPGFFGASGTLGRIPIRIVLMERPTIQTSTAKLDSLSNGKVVVGPFSYSKDEVKTDGKILELTPTNPEWIVLAVVSTEI
jgi:hypothetical protein